MEAAPPPPAMTEAEKQRRIASMKSPSKKSSFHINAKPETERQSSLHAFQTSRFRKSMSAKEIVTVDKDTGDIGRWVQPTIHYDESFEHVPPPPAGPPPADAHVDDDAEHTIKVLDRSAEGSMRTLLTRKSSGVYRKPPSMEDAKAAMEDVEERSKHIAAAKSQRRKSSFKVNAKRPEHERQACLKEFERHKSLTAEEVVHVCQDTGDIGRWIRPTIHYDESFEHVPPPPAGPPPADAHAADDAAHHVHVLDRKASGSMRKIPVSRRTSGIYRAPPTGGDALKTSDVDISDGPNYGSNVTPR